MIAGMELRFENALAGHGPSLRHVDAVPGVRPRVLVRQHEVVAAPHESRCAGLRRVSKVVRWRDLHPRPVEVV